MSSFVVQQDWNWYSVRVFIILSIETDTNEENANRHMLPSNILFVYPFRSNELSRILVRVIWSKTEQTETFSKHLKFQNKK